MIPVLVAGFNTVASKIYLILIPVLLDLVLWFAPKLSVKNLLMPLLDETISTLTKLGTTDMTATLAATGKIWTETLSQFSMLTALRTIPVGVPSIIARMVNQSNPLGTPLVIEIPSESLALLIFVGLTLIGFFIGTVYFNLLSRNTAPETEKLQLKQLGRQFVQNVWMALILLVVGLFLLIPVTFFISLFSIFGSGISQVLILTAGFILLWMLIPLSFSPHGVFVSQQKAMPSMMLSARLVRNFLPGTGTFVLICALISEGLNMVWTVTPTNSWLTLLGILGHAFIVTGLIVSTFIYYREGLKWMQESMMHPSAVTSKKPDNGGLFGRN